MIALVRPFGGERELEKMSAMVRERVDHWCFWGPYRLQRESIAIVHLNDLRELGNSRVVLQRLAYARKGFEMKSIHTWDSWPLSLPPCASFVPVSHDLKPGGSSSAMDLVLALARLVPLMTVFFAAGVLAGFDLVAVLVFFLTGSGSGDGDGSGVGLASGDGAGVTARFLFAIFDSGAIR